MVLCRRRKQQKSCLLFLVTCMTVSCLLQLFHDHYVDKTDHHDVILQQGSRDVRADINLNHLTTVSPSIHCPLTFNPKIKGIPWNIAYRINFGAGDKFFHPSENVINRFDVNFVLTGTYICNRKPPYLLVIVPTLPANHKTRDVIRATWASVVNNQTWPLRIVNADVKVVFLLGRNTTSEEFENIQKEDREHNDLVMADFVDSYRNLSRKILSGLTWIKTFCPQVRFILKCDEDTFVNIPLIVDFLLFFEPKFNFSVIGYIYGKSKVLRTGRWKVETSSYPLYHYPSYTSGNAYILSRDLAMHVLHVSERMPYIPVEDAYITGILTRAAGGRLINSKRFTYLGDKRPNVCDFVSDNRLAWTKATTTYKYAIWNAYKRNKCS